MRRFSSAVSFALLTALMFAGVASAHHSVQSQFDIHKTVTVSGTVSKVEWINPHSYLTLNVKDASGNTQKWAFELGAAGALRGNTMSRADRGAVRPGDEVTATALATLDGSNMDFLQELNVADGRTGKFATDGH